MRGKYNSKYKDVASELGGIKGFNSMSLMRRAISIFHFANYSYSFTIRCIHEAPRCMWQICIIILCHAKDNKK